MATATLPFVLCICLSLILLVNAYFEYYMLVQQYPDATCSGDNVNCKVPPPLPSMFTIHGLWPNNFSGASVVCPSVQTTLNPKSQLASIRRQLDTYWPNVIGGNNEDFWSYEWVKHGRCSNLNQLQYFQTALNLYSNPKYNLTVILNSAGFGPVPNKHEPKQDMASAIEAATGKKPHLRCQSRLHGPQLYEIGLCFKSDGTTLMDCPWLYSSLCSSTINLLWY